MYENKKKKMQRNATQRYMNVKERKRKKKTFVVINYLGTLPYLPTQEGQRAVSFPPFPLENWLTELRTS